jgi:hypothetical protein
MTSSNGQDNTQSSPDGTPDYNLQRQAEGQACLRAALDYLARGWSVVPGCTPDHVGMRKAHCAKCDSPGKAPWIKWKKHQDERPTETDVRGWWKDNCQANVGMALGPVSGLIRVDVDGPAGEARLAHISGGGLPPTLEFNSGRPNGGRGLLYAIPPGVELKTTSEKPKKGEELRFQAKGAFTVLPPSRHPEGTLYAWVPGHGPGEMEAAAAPAWLVEWLKPEEESPSELAGDEQGEVELVLDPNAKPPAEKFKRLLRYRKFRLSWERKRPDLKDQSGSGYDQSLTNLAARAGWSDQEIVDLCIAHQRTHGDQIKLRAAYYRHNIKKARKSIAKDRTLGVRIKHGRGSKEFALGCLTLRPGPAHRTPAGKVVVPLNVFKAGCLVDQFSLNGTPSGRKMAATHLVSTHFGDTAPDPREVQRIFASIVAAAAAEMEKGAGPQGPTLAEVVEAKVPQAFRLAFRNDKGGAWSEAFKREFDRTRFLETAGSSWLLTVAATAVDAPKTAAGGVGRPALVDALMCELKILWADLMDRLPVASAADLTPDSAAGQRFVEALTHLWHAPATFEKTAEGGEGVPITATLISRVRSQKVKFLPALVSRPRWMKIHPAYSAWWRPYLRKDDGGEVVEECILLAMRYELANQLRRSLPWVFNQGDLTTLGTKFGVLEEDPAVPVRTSAGKERLAVLNAGLCRELLAEPDEPVEATDGRAKEEPSE